MNVSLPRRTRRPHPDEIKRSQIEVCGERGASVAGLALTNRISANQLRHWMRERASSRLSCPACRYACRPPRRSVALSRCSFPPSLDAPIQLELRKGAAVITIEWPASSPPSASSAT